MIPTLLVAMTGVACIFLPPASDSKLNMAISVVLTYIFLQALVADLSPKAPTSPLFAKYILCSLLLAAFHVVACGLVWNLCTLPSRPHRCFRFLFVCQSPLLYFNSLVHFSRASHSEADCPKDTAFPDANQNEAPNKTLDNSTLTSLKLDNSTEELRAASAGCSNVSAVPALNPDSTPKLTSQKLDPECMVTSWPMLALAINRLISILYLLGNVTFYLLYLHPIVHRLIDTHHDPINYFDVQQREQLEDWDYVK